MAVPFTLCYGCLSFTNTSIAKWKNESCLYMTIIPVFNILTKHIELHLGIIQTWKRPTIPYEMNEAILLFFQLHLSLIGFEASTHAPFLLPLKPTTCFSTFAPLVLSNITFWQQPFWPLQSSISEDIEIGSHFCHSS